MLLTQKKISNTNFYIKYFAELYMYSIYNLAYVYDLEKFTVQCKDIICRKILACNIVLKVKNICT